VSIQAETPFTVTAQRGDIHGVVCLRRYVRTGTLRQAPAVHTSTRPRQLDRSRSVMALLATPFRTVPLKLHDPSIDSRPPADAGGAPDRPGSRDATGLARAFDGAQRASPRTEWMAARTATDPFPDLVHAVHAFVRACRAEGVPPERVLAEMKAVTSSCPFVCADGSRADRLQGLVLREFLVTYYDVATPARLARATPV